MTRYLLLLAASMAGVLVSFVFLPCRCECNMQHALEHELQQTIEIKKAVDEALRKAEVISGTDRGQNYER